MKADSSIDLFHISPVLYAPVWNSSNWRLTVNNDVGKYRLSGEMDIGHTPVTKRSPLTDISLTLSKTSKMPLIVVRNEQNTTERSCCRANGVFGRFDFNQTGRHFQLFWLIHDITKHRQSLIYTLCSYVFIHILHFILLATSPSLTD